MASRRHVTSGDRHCHSAKSLEAKTTEMAQPIKAREDIVRQGSIVWSRQKLGATERGGRLDLNLRDSPYPDLTPAAGQLSDFIPREILQRTMVSALLADPSCNGNGCVRRPAGVPDRLDRHVIGQLLLKFLSRNGA